MLSQAVDTFTSRDAETLWQLLGLAGIVASVGVALNFTGFQSYITHESKVRANLAISTLDTLLKKRRWIFRQPENRRTHRTIYRLCQCARWTTRPAYHTHIDIRV